MFRRLAAAVAIGGLVLTVGIAPSSSLAAADAPALWGSGDRPDDLFEYQFPEGMSGDQNAAANWFADLSATPGPADGDGCGTLPVGPLPDSSMPTLEPDDDPAASPTGGVSFTIDAAKICDGPAGPLTLLVVSGPTDAPYAGQSIRMVFARPAADQPFGRVAMEYQANACYTVGATAGFPGDASPAEPYLLQAWNFALDPGVDCASRAVVQETTTTTVDATTTAVPTSAAPTTSTTSSVPGTVQPAAAATPVSGTSTYAG